MGNRKKNYVQFDICTERKPLDEICMVPDRIISVYSLEKHVWAEANSEKARKLRRPELRTIEEFQIDPVRPFLNDILRNMAAPYKPERREHSPGQGYWIQAEFGSGKSHLLCFLAALALGDKDAWAIVKAKEEKEGRGRRESLYRFWEEGLEAKSSGGKKGIFVIVKTLVGSGGGTVGLSEKGRRLTEYILDAAKEQIQLELGKNLSLYPAELLADRFLSEDLDRYRNDLKKFLKDPRFFEEDEFEDINDFIRDIQQNKTPEYKRSCGNRLWRFYTEYLKVQPQIAAETEDILKRLVETILAEGYAGVLLVLDEVSLFMKNRDDDQRADDEKTLVVLANRLAKVHNLPVWLVCAAQQAIESKMGVKNIIADDRLKLVKLLEEDKDYYNIVLKRVREIKNPAAVGNYYLYYRRGFTWPAAIGEQEFRNFFPFHKPALEVLRAITYELTTTRSAIHFMHQTLKHQLKSRGRELVRLWELFDEAVRYEEDPSGVHAGLVAIKTKREAEYRAYEACRRQIDALTKGYLKVHRDKAIKVIQTLFLYHLARTRQQGITPEEIANSVLIERDPEATPEENIQHYETIAENLKKELRQIARSFDDDGRPRYRFDPVFTGVDPREEFRKARDEAEENEVMVREAWEHLLALGEWPVRNRQMTIDLSSQVRSIFHKIAPPGFGPEDPSLAPAREKTMEIIWQGRQVAGRVEMCDLGRMAAENVPLPPLDSAQTDLDFAVLISTRPAPAQAVTKLLAQRKDPRVLLWTPDELNHEERERLLDFAAYRKLVRDWQGEETEDAVAVMNWVAGALETELGKIARIVDTSYARGRIDALNNSRLEFHVAGELENILAPLFDRILTATYESRDIKFEPPFVFRKEEGVKVINGIVKTGHIPKGAKPNQNISAAQNFGFGLKIIKKSAERELDVADNPYVQDLWAFLDEKLADESQLIKVETIYKNFMGIGGPKNYGLSRRMVQIYLLCLVRQGKIRITVAPKAGLPFPFLDYANIAEIDFSARIPDSLNEVQKVARPENWEVLRPYAEKLLDETIPASCNDAEITRYRARLRDLFAREKEEAQRTANKAKTLFDFLKTTNPYAKEVRQFANLFAVDISAGNNLAMILFGLKESFGYQAFDANASSPAEVDDLAIRMKNYRDLQHFLGYEAELRAAAAYCRHPLPETDALKEVIQNQQKLAGKLTNLQPYIDSEVKLKTELLGHLPPEAREEETLGVLIHSYTAVYAAMHDSVVDRLENNRREINHLLNSDEMKALKILEGIAALQPAVSGAIAGRLTELAKRIFACPSPSRASVEEQLKAGPEHECGLSFQNAPEVLKRAETLAAEARRLFAEAFDRKTEVFLNPGVRERLEQGKAEPVIDGLLKCTDVAAVRKYLVEACLADRAVVEIINRYLKKILVKKVRMADFQPAVRTVEKGQIAGLAREFQQFLESHLQSIEGDEDTLPVLQVE